MPVPIRSEVIQPTGSESWQGLPISRVFGPNGGMFMATVRNREEKGSGVNVATHLLADVSAGRSTLRSLCSTTRTSRDRRRCEARQAVAKNMHLKNPDPKNPVAQLTVATNARLSLTGAAAYLRGRLEDEPAAPQEVAKAAGAMAGALEHLNVSYLAGQPDSDREQLGHDLDSRIAELGKLCE